MYFMNTSQKVPHSTHQSLNAISFLLQQDIYTAAVLAEKLTERHANPPQPWRDMMNTLSEVSCEAYRQVVRGDERFVPYFRSATPELELASLK